MFKCQLCNSQSLSNQSPIKLVLETRKRRYENQIRGKNAFKTRTIVSEGTEIVRETSVCKPCNDKAVSTVK